jgi:hypothetical protein
VERPPEKQRPSEGVQPRPAEETPPASAPDLRVEASPTRCPYCHDGVDQAELQRALVCQTCLSRHHAECWLDRCASCGSEQALGVVGATQTLERSPSLQRTLHVVNWGWLVAFLIGLVLMPITHEVAPASRNPLFEIPLMLTSLLTIVAWFTNLYDAGLHHRQRGAALVSAFLGPCTGGMTGFCYYLVWGRHAPSAPAAVPARHPPGPGKADPPNAKDVE